MRVLKRALGAAAAVGALAVLLRLRGRGGRPPTGAGWRELDLDRAGGSSAGPRS